MDNKEFNVMDMIDDYADEAGISAEDVFTQSEPKEEVKEKKEEKKVKPGEWMPDEEIMNELDEFKSAGGAVYNTDEIKTKEDDLKNIADEMIIKGGEDALADLQYKQKNIAAVKKRLGIGETHIPPGEWEMKFMLAAGDPDSLKAQAALEVLFKEFAELFPEAVIYVNESAEKEEAATVSESDNTDNVLNEVEPEETTVVIDKRQANEVTWSDDDISKIKKSRVIELNIVEGVDLELGSIEEINDSNAVDKVLSTYSRKTNDKVGVLPASKYRATFTGLTYPEVIDLSTSYEMNTLDAERKKWSIAFNHIKNPSIGPWKSYVTYRDEKNRLVKVNTEAEVPDGTIVNTIRKISEFDDFMKKTSYLDLEYILWMILCATAMNQEIVSVDCNAVINKEKNLRCKNTHDWIYCPSDVLQKESIPEFVLNDMQEAMDANSVEEIQKVYKTSPVNFNNYVTLHSSGFKMVYGHVSAYDYINHVYGKLKEIENMREKGDPSILSKAFSSSAVVAIDSFIITNDEGKQIKIKGVDNIIKILDSLDEIDWQIVTEVHRLILAPYQMKFAIKDIVCPKCKHKSNIPITDISRLLFIVARSLSNVNVTLKKQ